MATIPTPETPEVPEPPVPPYEIPPEPGKPVPEPEIEPPDRRKHQPVKEPDKEELRRAAARFAWLPRVPAPALAA